MCIDGLVYIGSRFRLLSVLGKFGRDGSYITSLIKLFVDISSLAWFFSFMTSMLAYSVDSIMVARDS